MGSSRAVFVPSLESLRGLAALAVCLFHACAIRLPSEPDAVLVANGNPVRALFNGHGAVILFFVLSGYVLRLALERRSALPAGPLSLHFLTARVFRIFPVAVATIALYSLAIWSIDGTRLPLSRVILNALLIQCDLLGHFWTMQTELAGSALVLAAYLVERRLGIRPVLLLTMLLLPLSFLGRAGQVTEHFHPGMLYTFMAGYLLARLPANDDRAAGRAALILVAAAVAFCALRMHGQVFSQWRLLATVICSAVMIHVLSGTPGRTWLQWWPVRGLGTVSYSFYAMHGFGLDLAQRMAGPIERLLGYRPLVIAALLLLAVGTSVVFAVASYLMIETPGMRLGRTISQRLLGGRRTLRAHVQT